MLSGSPSIHQAFLQALGPFGRKVAMLFFEQYGAAKTPRTLLNIFSSSRSQWNPKIKSAGSVVSAQSFLTATETGDVAPENISKKNENFE